MKLWPVSAASGAAVVATVVALAGNSIVAPVSASSVNFASARLHRVARRKSGVDADLEGWTDQEDVDQNKEELLAERDDLKAQLSTKNKEFLEQHRRADHLSRQVRMLEGRLRNERQREKAEEAQLKKARQALDRIGGEALVAAKEAVEAPAAAAKPVKKHVAVVEAKPEGSVATVISALNASAATSMLRTRRLHVASPPPAAAAASVDDAAEEAPATKGAAAAAAAPAAAAAAAPSFDVASALARVAPAASNKVAPQAAEADVDEQTEQQEDEEAVSTEAGAAAIGKLFADKDAEQQQAKQQEPEPQQSQAQQQTPQAVSMDSKVFADIEAQLNKEDARIDGYSFWSEDGVEKTQKPLLQRQQR